MPEDSPAAVSILNGSTPVENGTSTAWAAGANTLKITVTNGTEQEVYTVTVTKTGG